MVEWFCAFLAQSVERIHGKDEVTSSSLVEGSMNLWIGIRFITLRGIFYLAVLSDLAMRGRAP